MEPKHYKQDKIFIVDDDEVTAEIHRQHLLNLGCTDVTVFSSGLDCINALTDEPQIVLLDHNMEHLSGIEVLRKIKRFDPNIYVVFISGQEDIETAVSSLKYGAFDYIVKGPGQTERITKVLGRINNVRDLLNRKSPGFLRKMLSVLV